MADFEYYTDFELGEQGEHVTEVQTRLVEQGHLGEVTGTYDDLTQAALTNFATSGGYSYSTDLDLVRALQQATGALQSAEWVQRFGDADASYGYQANLDADYRGEHQPGNEVWTQGTRRQTYYAEGEDADQYKVGVQDGRLVRAEGALDALDTTEVSTHAGLLGSKPERMIFTMDSEGEMRVADPVAEMREMPGQRFHHSSLSAGGAVAGAGEIKVRDGEVEAVSDKSGHYRPDFAMTSQVNDRLADGGVDTSRVTFELGNFNAAGGASSETLATGTEVGSYDRANTLSDISAQLRKEAEEAAKGKWKPAVWARLADPIKQSEIDAFHARLYAPYEAMDDRTLMAEARKLLEQRHEALRGVLAELRQEFALIRGWKEDPTGRHQWRFYDGESWTAMVSDNDRQSEDPEGAATLGMPFAGSADLGQGPSAAESRTRALEDEEYEYDEDDPAHTGSVGQPRPPEGGGSPAPSGAPSAGGAPYEDLSGQQPERESTE